MARRRRRGRGWRGGGEWRRASGKEEGVVEGKGIDRRGKEVSTRGIFQEGGPERRRGGEGGQRRGRKMAKRKRRRMRRNKEGVVGVRTGIDG